MTTSTASVSTRPSKEESLLARGGLALQAIRFRKQAAEYAAAASELEQAIELARLGNPEQLQDLLDGPNGNRFQEMLPSLKESQQREWVAVPDGNSLEWIPDPIADRPVDTQVQPVASVAQEVSFWVDDESKNSIGDKGKSDALRAPKESPPTPLPGRGASIDSADKTKDRVQEKVATRNGKLTQPRLAKRRIPGWLLSTGLHAGLLVGLAVFTVKGIDPPRVLAIQSAVAESDEVNLTLSDPSDLDLPESMDLSESVSPSMSLASTSIESVGPIGLEGAGWSPADSPSGASTLGEDVSSAMQEAGKAGSGGGSNATRKAMAEFFGVQAAGNTFCYLVDSSGSMRRDGAFEAAKGELIRSVASLKPSQRFYIYFFSEETAALTLHGSEPEAYPVHATKENLQATMAWIQTIQIRSGKSPNGVLDLALQLDPDGIFLLFDGDTRVDVAKHLEKTNRIYDVGYGKVPRVPIHTVGFVTQEHEGLLKRIAAENLGTYRFIPSPKKLSKTMDGRSWPGNPIK